jgi:hypothetical protein
LHGIISVRTLSEHQGDKCDRYETPQNTKSDELPLLGLLPQAGVTCSPEPRAAGLKIPSAKIENSK